MAAAVCVVDVLSTYLADAALKMMQRNMRAELAACADCKLEA